MRQHGREQTHGELMYAEKVGRKLLLQRFAGEGIQRAIHAVTGIIKQAVKTITGQGDHLIGGVVNALRRVHIQQHAGKAQPVHAFDIVGFATGRQNPKPLALQFERAFQTDSTGTSCN